MKTSSRISALTALIVGGMLIAPLLAVQFLAFKFFELPFPAYDVFEWLSRILPGAVVRFGIKLMVDIITLLKLGRTDTAGKTGEQLLSVLTLAGLGIVATAGFFLLMNNALQRRAQESAGSESVATFGSIATPRGLWLGLAFGVIVGAISVTINTTAATSPYINFVWILLSFAVWGIANGAVLARLTELGQPRPKETALPKESSAYLLGRRQFLIQLGGTTATITVVGAGLSALLNNTTNSATSPAAGVAVPTVQPGTTAAPAATKAARVFANANDPVVPVPGTRPELTPVEQHYRIDINVAGAPRVDDNYKLPITGLVDAPTELSLDVIKNNFPQMEQIITMSCISNPVGGDLISTTIWQGISMQDLLTLVKPKANATHIKITGMDGFYEIVALDVIKSDPRVMLAHSWDGAPLPPFHGYPLRIHIPNRYGMKQPKWIDSMEFIDSWEPGYWVERGWDADAFVRATSVIDVVATDAIRIDGDKKFVPIGGMAWAGPRGISKVEVRVDGGDWNVAQLRKPMSDKSWNLWRYEWIYSTGNHEFEVRCVEADGTPQIESFADVAPSGATGIDSFSANL